MLATGTRTMNEAVVKGHVWRTYPELVALSRSPLAQRPADEIRKGDRDGEHARAFRTLDRLLQGG